MSHFYTQIFTQNCLIDALGTCSEENCKKALIDSNGISTSAVRNLQAFWLYRASHIPKLSRWLSIYLGISACPCCMVHQIGYGGLENVILCGQWRCYPNKLRFKPTFLHSIAMHWELNPHWWSTTSIREKKTLASSSLFETIENPQKGTENGLRLTLIAHFRLHPHPQSESHKKTLRRNAPFSATLFTARGGTSGSPESIGKVDKGRNKKRIWSGFK